VNLKPFIPHDELIELYAGATAAFDLYRPNPERELAITTRTVEYMWAGLPVIYADYGELARPIDQCDAGWVVDPQDEQAVEKAVREAIDDPRLAAKKGNNAQSLVRRTFTWKSGSKT
jgi:glycosyltransferase involved in cell wall biosynthesis